MLSKKSWTKSIFFKLKLSAFLLFFEVQRFFPWNPYIWLSGNVEERQVCALTAPVNCEDDVLTSSGYGWEALTLPALSRFCVRKPSTCALGIWIRQNSTAGFALHYLTWYLSANNVNSLSDLLAHDLCMQNRPNIRKRWSFFRAYANLLTVFSVEPVLRPLQLSTNGITFLLGLIDVSLAEKITGNFCSLSNKKLSYNTNIFKKCWIFHFEEFRYGFGWVLHILYAKSIFLKSMCKAIYHFVGWESVIKIYVLLFIICFWSHEDKNGAERNISESFITF